jgi:integrase
MRQAGDGVGGERIRGLIVVLWRSGLRIQEALELHERDLDPRRGALLVRHGKGGRRREVGMDDWGWEHLNRWVARRLELPLGPLFCAIDGPTRGRPWRRQASGAGVRTTRQFAQVSRAWAARPRRAGAPRLELLGGV